MDTDVLNFLIANGMIDLSDVRQKMENMERQSYLEKHAYAIYEGKDGYWYTYLPDKTKKTGRRQVKRRSRIEVEDVVIEYYKQESDDPTLNDIFTAWNDRRLAIGLVKKSTHSRNCQIYKTYFAEFGNRRAKSLSPDDICDFLETWAASGITSKAYLNLKGVLRGMLKYAKKKKYISFGVEEALSEIDISDFKLAKKVIDDKSEVFVNSEVGEIMAYCYEHRDDACCLGVALMFVTGLRVGEIVALKGIDISDFSITIKRGEMAYQTDGHVFFEVVEHPKTPAGFREVIVPDKYRWILTDLKERSGEFIFIGRNGKRLHTGAIRKRMYQICRRLEIRVRSPHKARKTYGSILLDNGVDVKLIEKQMGHTDISCTENFYHRDRRNVEEKRRIINGIPEFE